MTKTFNRPPRIQTPLPDDEVEIAGPPALPSSPGPINWLTFAIPLGATVFSVILMVFMFTNNSSGLTYLIFLPIMLATYVVTVVTQRQERGKYTATLAKTQSDYDAALRNVETTLQKLQRRQQRILRETNPDLADCLQHAKSQDTRLGERRPGDSDFLAPRLGSGSLPASYRIKRPDQKLRPPELEKQLQFADRLYETYSKVADVPITADLANTGSVGIAGKRADVLGAARAFITHLVTHHWLAEVQVAVIGKPGTAGEWKWMHDLPHATGLFRWQAVTADGDQPPANLMAALEAEIQRRAQFIEIRKQMQDASKDSAPPLPRLVIVFDSLPPDYNHPGLSLLLEKDREVGIYGVFLTEQAQRIPSECGAIIEVQANRLSYRESGAKGRKADCIPDMLDVKQAGAVTRALSAINWQKSDDVSQPPAMLTFLDMFGASKVEDLPIEEWWEGESPYKLLRAPIGKTSATAELIFDLNDRDGSHGPHGLIGGMTGSGKSEVLKTVILALAVTHHPYDLNFALVDFKGGAAFNELAHLPHTVGIVTDIETHASYAERVILALAGEIEHRKRILEEARAAFGFGRSHVDEYRLLRVKRPLPRLVIVFDEFAEFKQRHPEESKRLISIARLGRSLGVHLILATQNIQAAIDPQILQNSTFRICLRVSEPQDSVQMVGIPDAVHLSRGRAYFMAQTRKLYQSAFAGGAYHAGANTPTARGGIKRIRPDGTTEIIPAPGRTDGQSLTEARTTEAHAVIERLNEATRNLNLKKPPAVWPDPLPDRLHLPGLLDTHVMGGWDGTTWRPARYWTPRPGTSGMVHPVLGIYDNPAKQEQVVLELDPGRGNGHLLVFGAASSGKSVLIRTLVTSIARTRSPSEAHIYVLDFGGQSTLSSLEKLPHVGAVVTRFELERAERLIQYMHAEVARRNELFQQARVDGLRSYNERAGEGQKLPAIYLILDGFLEFKRTFPIEVVNSVAGLVSGGVAAGLFLVIASSLQSDIPQDLFANINERVSFNQADQSEYYRIVGQPSEAKMKEEAAHMPPPGRGLLRGTPPLEFQAALPTSGADRDEARQLIELGEKMQQAWAGPLPPEIRSLPLLYTLPLTPAAPPPTPYFSVLGQDYETLGDIGLSLAADGPTFLVAGATPHSGKTTLLQTWALGLAERYTSDQLLFVFVDFHTRTMAAFRNLPHTWQYVGSKSGLDRSLAELIDLIKSRVEAVDNAYEADPDNFDSKAYLSDLEHVVVIVDSYDVFAMRVEDNLRKQLGECLIKGGDFGVSFIIAGNVSELPREFDDPLIQRMKRHGCGALLGGGTGIDTFNNARPPSFQALGALPPGRGYLIRRGQVRLFQAATYWQEGEDPVYALARRLEQIGPRA